MKAIVHVLVSLALATVLSACAVAGSTSISPSESGTAPEPGPSPTNSHGDDHQHELGLEAQVDPSCIAPGEDVTLTVDTDPRAPVIYLAFYSDGGSGADEPLGEGYGGNDGGFADSSGRYKDAWTVSEGAPPGLVRVEVKAAAAGQHGETEASFTLATPGESCPRAD